MNETASSAESIDWLLRAVAQTPGSPVGALPEHVGRYRVLRLLGRGGMGVVLEAHDPALDRRVALKVLPLERAADPEARRRLLREAKASSALSHPHVVTVFEVGEAPGDGAADVLFIAMELIDGETLAERLRRGDSPWAERAGWLADVASVLGKAHAAGIVHRDLKPQNVMITRDGFAKVLDFGLAKRATPEGAAETATRAGAVLGTIGYMAPEQVLGGEVGPPADVFSFGCLVYEALCGARPFNGRTDVETVHRLAYEPHAPLPATSDAGQAVVALIERCLDKEPARRPSMSELEAALREARPTANGEAAAPRATRRSSVLRWSLLTALAAALGVWGVWTASQRGPAQPASAPRVDSATPPAPPAPPPPPSTVPAQPPRLRKLQTHGRVTRLAVSPDGAWLAYAAERSEGAVVALRPTGDGNEVLLVAPTPARIFSVLFAPDGASLYYVALPNGRATTVLYRVSTRGGASERVVEEVDGEPNVAPDGRTLYFPRCDAKSGLCRLLAFETGVLSPKPRVLAERRLPAQFGLPRLSPDGRKLAFVSFGRTPSLMHVELLDLATGQLGRAPGLGFRFMQRLAWSPDGRALYVTGGSGVVPHLWRVDLESGARVRIAHDLHGFADVASAARGNSVVALQKVRVSKLWQVSLQGSTEPRPLGDVQLIAGMSFAPNGELVVAEEDGQGTRLIGLRPDTHARRIIATPGLVAQPRVDPEGGVVFVSDRDGQFRLWRVDTDGGGLRALSPGPLDWQPSITHTGDVHYQTIVDGRMELWRVGAQRGAPARATPERWLHSARVSPDGRTVAAFSAGEDMRSPVGLRLAALREGGHDARWLLPTLHRQGQLEWTADGRGVAYVVRGAQADNVVVQSVAGGPPTPLTRFGSQEIYGLAFARDGRTMVCIRGDEQSQVVLLDVRP